MNLFRKTVRLLKTILTYLALWIGNRFPSKMIVSNKALQLNLNQPEVYHRYLYTFIKQFIICGYEVYMPVNFSNFRKINTGDDYLKLLLHEKNFHFRAAPTHLDTIFLDDSLFSPDYFTPLFSITGKHKNIHHIPMPLHPLMYLEGLWNLPISKTSKRKKSIFMCGNFDKNAYEPSDIDSFITDDRIRIYDFLSNQKLLNNKILSIDELTKFVQSKEDHQCIIIKRTDFEIPMIKLRPTLSQFSFFLAMPGVSMPLCHNIVEALSVGMIPLLHQEYANLMRPPLKHNKNALIYNNLNELKQLILDSYQLSDTKIDEMRNNVNNYYNKNMTPKAVVQSIEKNTSTKLFLMAEYGSVKYLEKSVLVEA